MAIGNKIQYAKIDDLFLDPMNPRLGRNNVGTYTSQEDVLDLMQNWTLDELAISFLESGGFWVQEALLVSREKLYDNERLVVIEGNRRLAALKMLYKAHKGESIPVKWLEMIRDKPFPEKLFTEIPYIIVDSREEIEAFLGFRHVTGIKEWAPAEKAEFIARLIDNSKMSYEEVRRKIGSKAPTVRQNYITYRVLRQMENTVEEFSPSKAEARFSVMYLSLATKGAQEYLGLDIYANPDEAHTPVPSKKIEHLRFFSKWLFGDKETSYLFPDSRSVSQFGQVLESPDAVEYLERTPKPDFDFALQKAGADASELIQTVSQAVDNIELSIARINIYKDDVRLRAIVKRLFAHVDLLHSIFPVSDNNP